MYAHPAGCIALGVVEQERREIDIAFNVQHDFVQVANLRDYRYRLPVTLYQHYLRMLVYGLADPESQIVTARSNRQLSPNTKFLTHFHQP